MATKTLHITNGDFTTNYLKSLNFSGDFITWREMLCEGKTTTDVGSENFWKNRFEFLKSSYKVSKKKFIDYTLKEYRTLCNKKSTDEIVLWFDHGLFCQINMVAVISWLKRYRQGYHITLVQSGKIAGTKKIKGINDFTEKQVHKQFKERVTLTKDDIEYADYIWQLYCSDSPLRLETVHQFNPMSPFQNMTTVLEAHIRRFPTVENGLNFDENNILRVAQAKEFDSKEKLVKQLLKEDEVYGFGDVQYDFKINNLKKLFSSFNPVKLNHAGKKVLENQLNFYGQIRDDNSYFGGSRKYSFLYHTPSQKLMQITA